MSFVSIIRDYVEMLNHLSDSLGNDFTLKTVFFESLGYIFQTLKLAIIYIFSFQWIRNFTLLPTTIPSISSSIFRETFFLETPSKIFFEFLEIPSLDHNKLVLGFFNSFFFTLPISVIHLISVRRLLIQGIPAGVFSISGYLFGQFLFLICVIFGIRFILIPWLTFEPLSYILGLLLIFRIIYSMVQESLSPFRGWDLTDSRYQNFFLTSFALAWCEQTSILQYLGNISITSNPTLLEGFSTNSSITSLLSHTNYLIGIFCGSIFFTLLWGGFFIKCRDLIISYTPLFKSSFMQLLNTTTFVVAIGFSLSSIPYYGLDYLFTGPLGFVSQDKSFNNTIFSTYNVKDTSQYLGGLSNYETVEIDVSPFDRGRYMLFPQSQPFTFEDLNYQGEAEWTTRADKMSSITDSKSGFLTLSKIIKPKQSGTSQIEFEDFKKYETLNTPLPEKNFGAGTDTSSFGQRIQDWYDLNPEAEEDKNRIDLFQDFTNSSFSTEFLQTKSIFEPEVEQKIKHKYYTNPIYKNLLALDIDLFLNRQPANFKISNTQELDLVNKRRILNSYYDSLRAYSKLPYSEDFEEFFDGSKSFSNKVYNQQFKGTLKSLRRLFTLTPTKGRESSQVLKFDQLHYDFSADEKFFPYHEELVGSELNITDSKNSPFIRDTITRPLYAGWDENLRKFVITNKLMPRTAAGYEMNLSSELSKKFTYDSQFSQDKTKSQDLGLQKIQFTVWPLTKEQLDKPKKESKIPYVTLFVSKENSEKEGQEDLNTFGTFSTVPSNWETFKRQQSPSKEFDNLFDYLAPRRGGFIWPGSSMIQFSALFNPK